MPHVIVKLWPGRNDEIKSNLAKRIAHTVAEELKVDMGDKLVGKHEHCYVEKEFKGNDTAKSLIEELMQRYPRKPALLDELEKVEKKL